MTKTENYIRIRGYVGKDPEYRLTSKGNQIAKLVLGTEDIIFNEVKKQWHNVVVTGQDLVQKVKSEVLRGSRLVIVGILYYHKSNIGSHEKFITDIVVDDSGTIEIEVESSHVVIPYSD